MAGVESGNAKMVAAAKVPQKRATPSLAISRDDEDTLIGALVGKGAKA